MSRIRHASYTTRRCRHANGSQINVGGYIFFGSKTNGYRNLSKIFIYFFNCANFLNVYGDARLLDAMNRALFI